MEGTTRAEPEDRGVSKLEWTAGKHGGMVEGSKGGEWPRGRGAGGRAEGPGFWFCRPLGVGACSDGCELGGHMAAGLCTARGADRLTGYCNSPDEEGWCLCEMAE